MPIVKACIVPLLFIFSTCNPSIEQKKSDQESKHKTPTIPYQYVRSLPHDTTSFIEGLVVHNGQLYESTGSPADIPYCKSVIGILNLVHGGIERKIVLSDDTIFGEGIVFLKSRLYQLTYKNKIGFIYDASTFEKVGEFAFPSKEGWGMTTDGNWLIMSDGTNILTYLDPVTLKVMKKLAVTEYGKPKMNLNELEFIQPNLYANVWPSNQIVRIDPVSGNVTGEIDLTSFATHAKSVYPGALEMNGIAYDSASNSIYITGKLWPKVFELKINF